MKLQLIFLAWYQLEWGTVRLCFLKVWCSHNRSRWYWAENTVKKWIATQGQCEIHKHSMTRLINVIVPLMSTKGFLLARRMLEEHLNWRSAYPKDLFFFFMNNVMNSICVTRNCSNECSVSLSFKLLAYFLYRRAHQMNRNREVKAW